MRRLRWVGRTVLQELERRLVDAARAWVCEWGVAERDARASCRSVPEVASPADLAISASARARLDGSTLQAHASKESWAKILLPGLADLRMHDPLLDALLQDAATALIRRMVAELELSDAEVKPGGLSVIGARPGGSGWIHAEMDFAGTVIDVIVHPAMLAGRSSGRPPQSDGSLVPRRDVLGRRPCTVRVSLDLGEFSISEIDALRPGALISTAVPLSTPFELRIGGRVKVPVMLGRRDDRKAITFVSPEDM